MVTHSSIFAWEIAQTEEPGQSMGLHIVRHKLATKQPPPLSSRLRFLPSTVSYSCVLSPLLVCPSKFSF